MRGSRGREEYVHARCAACDVVEVCTEFRVFEIFLIISENPKKVQIRYLSAIFLYDSLIKIESRYY